MKREFAIIVWNKANNLAEMAQKLPVGSSITAFYKNGIEHADGIKAVDMPIEVDNQAKSKNWTISWWQEQMHQGADVEWLHVIEDNLDIVRDPTQFIDDIENMLGVLDINSWLNTTTDICNRVYAKYNPRLKVKIDQPEFQKFNLGEVRFCSHSNTQWMLFNLKKADAEELHFNDSFEIAMYWIIEYLARRRNTQPNTLYFMNQYVTCASEENLFKNKQINSSDEKPSSEDQEKKMKEEDGMFKELGVNYTPDNNIDIVMERLLLKLRSKI